MAVVGNAPALAVRYSRGSLRARAPGKNALQATGKPKTMNPVGAPLGSAVPAR